MSTIKHTKFSLMMFQLSTNSMLKELHLWSHTFHHPAHRPIKVKLTSMKKIVVF